MRRASSGGISVSDGRLRHGRDLHRQDGAAARVAGDALARRGGEPPDQLGAQVVARARPRRRAGSTPASADRCPRGTPRAAARRRRPARPPASPAILLANTALTAASGPITAIIACGSAMVASGSKPGPHIAYRPAPYALRNTTQIFGTVASATARDHLRAVADDPLALDRLADHEAGHVGQEQQRDPEGVAQPDEARRLVGASRRTARRPSTWAGWRRCRPARPSRRAKPVTSSRANSFLSSKKLPSSTSASMTCVDVERLVLVGGEDVVDPLRARRAARAAPRRAAASPARCGQVRQVVARRRDGRRARRAPADRRSPTPRSACARRPSPPA